jgi:hypothetical protein
VFEVLAIGTISALLAAGRLALRFYIVKRARPEDLPKIAEALGRRDSGPWRLFRGQ